MGRIDLIRYLINHYASWCYYRKADSRIVHAVNDGDGVIYQIPHIDLVLFRCGVHIDRKRLRPVGIVAITVSVKPSITLTLLVAACTT